MLIVAAFCLQAHHVCTMVAFWGLANSWKVLVGPAGLEPARPYGQQILSLQRLPFRHGPLKEQALNNVRAPETI